MNIILAHGFLGFGEKEEKFHFEYFNEVRERLAQQFQATLFVPGVYPTRGIKARGEELRGEILQAFENGPLDPNQKAHLIAHSMGGLDCRYILSTKNEHTTPANDVSGRIASLTTISTPHRGTPIADLLAPDAAERPAAAHHLRGFFDGLLAAEHLVAHLFRHVIEGLDDLTTESTAQFNAAYPDHPGVHYFSVAGRGRDAGNPTAHILSLTYQYIKRTAAGPNDGLVPVESAKWGAFDGDLWPADHADEIGHNLDDPLGKPTFKHLERYDAIVRRVQGLKITLK